MWVATQDLPRSAAHPFYTRLNQILDKADFDAYVETLCQRFYADDVGRPGLPPGRYFRMLLLGYFEGLDSERAIAWRTVDSLSIRACSSRAGRPMAVYRVYQRGKAEAIVENVPAPADLGLDAKRGRVLIPQFTENRLRIVRLPGR